MSREKDESLRTLFKGGGILLVGIFLELSISFLAKLLIARELSLTDFGGVTLGITVSTIVGLLSVLGMREGLARYLPRSDSDAETRSVLVTGYILGLSGAVVGGAIIVAAAPILAALVFSAPEITQILQIFGLAVPLIGLNHLALGTIQGSQRTVPKVLMENLARPITRISALGIVFAISATAVNISWAYFASWLVPGLIGCYFLWSQTSMFQRGVSITPRYRELLAFSLPLLVSSAMSFILSDIDTLVLGAFRSPEEVAIYGVAYTIADLLTVGLTAFSFIFLPVISELHAKDQIDEMRRIYQVVTKWITVLTLPVFLIVFLFPRAAITIPFGAKYSPGATTLSILAVGIFLHALMGLNSATLTSTGHPKLVLYGNAITAMVNLVLNIILIPPLGYLGAGIATVVSYVVLNAVFSGYLYREYSVVPVTQAILRPSLLAGVLIGLFYVIVKTFFSPNAVVLFAFLAVFLALYGVLLLRYGGIESEELMLLDSIEERFGVDLGLVRRIGNSIMRSE